MNPVLTLVRCMMVAAMLTGAGTAQSDITRAGKTFVVTLHPGKLGAELAARLADEALAAAESTRPVLDKLYQRPAKPPTIHVYLSRDEYDPVAKDPRWQFVRDAVCRHEQAESHVMMRPVLNERLFGEVGLPETTRDAIVMQAAMLAACERSELARSDPWHAEVFASGVLDATAFANTRDGVDPGRDSRFWYLSREAKKNLGRTLRSFVENVAPIQKPEELDYMLQGKAAIARLLAGTGTGWAKKLLNTKVKDPTRLASQRTDAVQAVLGSDDKRNEERFAKVLTSSEPQFCTTRPLAALRGGRILLAAGKEYAWVGGANPPPTGPYAIRATVVIVTASANGLVFRLDSTETSGFDFTCKANKISLTMRDIGAARVEQPFTAPIEIGKPFALSFEVRDTIQVLVDGQQVADVPLAGHTMRNDWWIVIAEAMAWLENLRCEPLAPPAKK